VTKGVSASASRKAAHTGKQNAADRQHLLVACLGLTLHVFCLQCHMLDNLPEQDFDSGVDWRDSQDFETAPQTPLPLGESVALLGLTLAMIGTGCSAHGVCIQPISCILFGMYS